MDFFCFRWNWQKLPVNAVCNCRTTFLGPFPCFQLSIHPSIMVFILLQQLMCSFKDILSKNLLQSLEKCNNCSPKGYGRSKIFCREIKLELFIIKIVKCPFKASPIVPYIMLKMCIFYWWKFWYASREKRFLHLMHKAVEKSKD